MNLKRISLGSFQLTSNQMAVSDPCYDSDVPKDIRGVLNNVKTGTWNSFAYKGELPSWGERVYELQVLHESVTFEKAGNSAWMLDESFQVGVDSGQAGFFDNSKYPYGNLGQYGEEETFYGRACEMTLNEEGGGVIDDFGVASSSGIGDGCYECYVLHNDQDEIVGAKIIFLNPDSEENDVEI